MILFTVDAVLEKKARCLGATPHEPINLATQFIEIVHIQVNTSKTDVGHLINLGQMIQHHIADHTTMNFTFADGLERFNNLVNNCLNGIAANGSFGGRRLDARQ